ncbi:hypothetical protein ILUMI_01483 [Ignelater luminosus]|uniref:C2H2-type domain-containing protein n=1 Tax=Ignelater luminosus TaxID=2038154 RepID=A0A8K0DJY9_IGNLU|nr:hypothetical protein ILUMI_01483 [Ignelater luminosus]
MDKINKVYPTAEELQTVNTCLHCTEEGCTSIFSSESNLTLHLIKTHKKERKTDTTVKEYYCPDLNCVYNEEKFFKNLKLLKQHYLKVHGDKSFICEGCSKGFSTMSSKNRHAEYCGVNFKCCDCEVSYPCYESLLTHGRRKQHKVLEKAAYNPAKQLTQSGIDKCSSGPDVKVVKKEAFVLPKASTSLQVVNFVPLVIKTIGGPTFDKGSQTDCCSELPKLKTKQTQVNKERPNRKHSSKHSQTSELRKTRSSAETQTIGDYISKKPKLSVSHPDFVKYANSSEENSLQKSIKTQTKVVTSKTKSCNTSFELDESEYVSNPIIQRSTSSTQTTTTIPTELLYSISTATHDSIHTDTSDLNFEFMHSSSQTCFNEDMSIFDSSSFFNCNIETQTDFMFDNDLLNYQDCYSNMETQTIDSSPVLKDEIMSMGTYNSKAYDDILFNTIHTQTMFDDMARSVQSQTMMSHNKMHNLLTCRDMANMETQTEVDFKKLLEEINA